MIVELEGSIALVLYFELVKRKRVVAHRFSSGVLYTLFAHSLAQPARRLMILTRVPW